MITGPFAAATVRSGGTCLGPLPHIAPIVTSVRIVGGSVNQRVAAVGRLRPVGAPLVKPMGDPVVATVRVETVIDLPAQRVWDAIADVGAVHRRLLPGRVADVRLEDDTRILTMPDGSHVRELIVSVDHSIRRMAYAVVEGQRLALTYHHAAFQVIAEGDQSRLVWLTDVLPHAAAAAVQARVERGIVEIRQVLESTAAG